MVGGRARHALAVGVGVSALATRPLAAQTGADLVVTNSIIYTVDPEAPLAEAMAVSGGVIVAIGSAEEVEPYRGPETTVIDLGGQTVIPGLIDAHAHVMNLGMFLRTVDLVGTRDIEEIADPCWRGGGRKAGRGMDPGARVGSERLAGPRVPDFGGARLGGS